MSDVFERRADLQKWRERLWDVISQTPMLDWLLLTKRPQNVEGMTPWGNGEWPDNVWLGTTVENQHWANQRLPHLAAIPARIRFLSCEPLLGYVDLSDWIESIDWVIAGGESGHHSRPMSPGWARRLRDQCNEGQVAFHFKQWGHWSPDELLTAGQKKVVSMEGEILAPVGKGKAGRKLDGRTWDELPDDDGRRVFI